ncbi:MAG: chemotaxis protein CheR [Bacteroidetes bacterium HGW-Bacteroidetes-21]|jgi:chemotaxis protein methyltransferase CheR|nr:MAG: chemotaxis protein CheR [Bacteroidetes bacterium HGW-Bacteroidetes-21]
MNIIPINNINVQLTLTQFRQLSSFIYTEVGIKMPEAKKTMLESRLLKRLRALSIDNFNDYIEYLFSKEGIAKELVQMLDVVTTNKTDFFREPIHFEYLTQIVIPEYLQKEGFKPMHIWSAGCSTGEEPYTLSMVLEYEVEKGIIPGYNIYATDISTKVLEKAIEAVYQIKTVENIPIDIKRKFFLKHKDPNVKTVRIKPELRSKIVFDRFNFMDETYLSSELYDVIFCRNVIIYFDRQTQEKVITKLCSKIKTGGYLFLGHSESITNLKVPLKSIRPTVFKKL